MTSSSASSGHAEHMDRMYRYTRHVYDATRRYYLLGRDHLLNTMRVRPGDRVLEMGCGTARNLIRLHRIQPRAELFGLDAAQVMLDTAAESLRRKGVKATLRQCLAEQFHYQQTFGLDEKFDIIFFSYSLSMMPTWREAVTAAFESLKADGRIYIVDFWDQAGLHKTFAWILQNWLALFHVHHRPELLGYLLELQRDGRCTVALESIGGRYAYIAKLERVR